MADESRNRMFAVPAASRQQTTQWGIVRGMGLGLFIGGRQGALGAHPERLDSAQTSMVMGPPASPTIAWGTNRAESRVIGLESSRMPMPLAASPTTQLPISG